MKADLLIIDKYLLKKEIVCTCVLCPVCLFGFRPLFVSFFYNTQKPDILRLFYCQNYFHFFCVAIVLLKKCLYIYHVKQQLISYTMKNLVEFNGFWFSESTSDRVKGVIVNNYRKNRLRFWFGDVATGKSWDDEHDVCGYIGRSTGGNKIPLLIENKRSSGGGAILDDCIVKIVDINTKSVLYQHPNFNQSVFTVSGNEVFQNGEIYGRCKNETSASRLCDFMNGKRYNK